MHQMSYTPLVPQETVHAWSDPPATSLFVEWYVTTVGCECLTDLKGGSHYPSSCVLFMRDEA
eukprot:3945238-Amphidinium_carterae.2